LLNAADLEAVQRTGARGHAGTDAAGDDEAFEILSAEHPLVLVLEDLHWSESVDGRITGHAGAAPRGRHGY